MTIPLNMDKDYLESLYREHQESSRCPSPLIVNRFFDNVLGFLFPEYSLIQYKSFEDFESRFEFIRQEFLHILSKRNGDQTHRNLELSTRFFSILPEIKEKLLLDIEAMYQGDPAARSTTEVVRTYPGFYAIASHRIAHFLFNEGLTLIARMISEHAHSKTGIDIHPGATIGDHFCIDHGTGIVIGETTEIGNYVKIYQGVTLGALSVSKDKASEKRHPVIEDHVVIYAGATILGGKTVIGHHSIIGGSVWLTESVPPYSKIYYDPSLKGEQTE